MAAFDKSSSFIFCCVQCIVMCCSATVCICADFTQVKVNDAAYMLLKCSCTYKAVAIHFCWETIDTAGYALIKFSNI